MELTNQPTNQLANQPTADRLPTAIPTTIELTNQLLTNRTATMTLHLTSIDYANPLKSHAVIGCPMGTRLHRIVRVDPETWLLWIATNDFILGTYLLLHSSGLVERITARADEGDETYVIRPNDRDIQTNEDTK